MIVTSAELSAWIGRPLFDPYDAWVGTIAAVRVDPDSGAPEWLEVTLGQDGSRRVVPSIDAVPSGGAIRTPHVLQKIVAGDAMRATPPPRERPVQSQQAPVTGAARAKLARALQRTHGELRATLERIAALRRRVEDAELVHDLTFHHTNVEGHAADLRRRLAELEDVRSPLRDGLLKLGSQMHVKRRAGRSATADAREAIDLARAELERWRSLGKLAALIGDGSTERMAARGAADAEAFIYTVAASWRRFQELDHQRRGTSKFAPPPDLAELAPRT